jgi:hypothetical protein
MAEIDDRRQILANFRTIDACREVQPHFRGKLARELIVHEDTHQLFTVVAVH